MTNEELKTKYADQFGPIFVLKDVTNVNHKPHPYTVGTAHITHASKYHGGILGDATCEQVQCCHRDYKGGPRCTVPYDQHTSDRVAAIQLTRDCTNLEAAEELRPLADAMSKDGLDGFVFVETDEKFRVNEDNEADNTAIAVSDE